jgi:hypothetical protein
MKNKGRHMVQQNVQDQTFDAQLCPGAFVI